MSGSDVYENAYESMAIADYSGYSGYASYSGYDVYGGLASSSGDAAASSTILAAASSTSPSVSGAAAAGNPTAGFNAALNTAPRQTDEAARRVRRV